MRPKLLVMINKKLHIRFRLVATSMTLVDLELFEVRTYREFCRFGRHKRISVNSYSL